MDAYIRIDNISKSYADKKVLRGVSIAMSKNESVVIIGRSGCGKSVLLKHLNGLIRPDSGTVFVEGNDISCLPYKELVGLRKNIGMLFQSAALLDSLSVGENVGLGLKEAWSYSAKEVRKIVEEKLDLVGLAGTADIYPSELSGGMRKRVGLARAISTGPEILLYDEPTTGLDPITADMIDDLIVNLNEKLKVTSVTVTHDMKSAYRIGDRIVMLYQGRVEFDGTPEQIKNSGNEVVDRFITGRAGGPLPIH
jgi:phospholipid/cholesterol/gamma-HCH transport system ATP-binding protein